MISEIITASRSLFELLHNMVIFEKISYEVALHAYFSGGSRNSERGFPLVIDPRCRGLGAAPRC